MQGNFNTSEELLKSLKSLKLPSDISGPIEDTIKSEDFKNVWNDSSKKFKEAFGFNKEDFIKSVKKTGFHSLVGGSLFGVGVGASYYWQHKKRRKINNTQAIGAGALVWSGYELGKMIIAPKSYMKSTSGLVLKSAAHVLAVNPNNKGLPYLGATLVGAGFGIAGYGKFGLLTADRNEYFNQTGAVLGSIGLGAAGAFGGYRVGRALSKAISINL